MVRRKIRSVRRGQPAFASRHAQGDRTAWPHASPYLLQKVHRRGLVLQHFEKCDHIKPFFRVLRRKFGNRQGKNSLQAEPLFRKARGIAVQFKTRNAEASVASRAKKIPRTTATVQKSTAKA